MALFVVTGGGGFIGSNLVEAILRRRGLACACSTTSRPGRRENLRAAAAWAQARRRARSSWSRATSAISATCRRAIAGRGLRAAPGRDPVGAALGRGPARLQRGQRRRHAQPPRGRARREGEALRLRVVVVALRRERDAPQGRDDGPRADLALRPAEARGGDATAASSTACTACRRSRCATSTSSARGRTRTSEYSAVIPRFIAAIATAASRRRSTATASRRATSRYIANVVQANLQACEAGPGGAAAGRTTSRAASASA